MDINNLSLLPKLFLVVCIFVCIFVYIYFIQKILFKLLLWLVPYNRRLATINPVAGKTYDEIVAVIGHANSHTPMPHITPNADSPMPTVTNGTLRQWISPIRGHVALIFDEDNVCLGLKHEFSLF